MSVDLPTNPETCSRCGWNLIPSNRWRQWTPTERQQAKAAHFRPKNSRETCRICRNALNRTADRLPTRLEREAEQERIRTERLEDIRWMADNGEHLEGAAMRLGLTMEALHTFLIRNGERELASTMRSRNPRDHNQAPDGSDISRILPNAGYDQKLERKNERRKAARQGVAA